MNSAVQEPGEPGNHCTLSAHELALVKSVFTHHPQVTLVTLFGSRAKGVHTPQSDIDLALSGTVSALQAQAIAAELEELPLPYCFDVQPLNKNTPPDLREHIERVGIVLYP
jgi:uncharacterized protein